MPPAQITGFLDGDGSFGLYAADIDGQQMGVRLVVATRDDDVTPALIAASVSASLGRSIGSVNHSPRARQVNWRVSAADELAAVLRWLSDTPSLAPRAWRRMTVVREAALILMDGRELRGRWGRLSRGDRARLVELNEALLDKRAILDIPETLRLASTDQFGWYLSGFFAAEGHLALRSHPRGVRHAAVITQRVDNIALLNQIRQRTEVGSVRIYRGPKGAPYARWAVESRDECRRFGLWLVRHPLPPASPKAQQLRWWLASLNRRFDPLPPARRRRAADRYAAGVRALRAYKGPRDLCICESEPPADGRVLPASAEGRP
jgi:hypothetical protein